MGHKSAGLPGYFEGIPLQTQIPFKYKNDLRKTLKDRFSLSQAIFSSMMIQSLKPYSKSSEIFEDF